ncbi:MAG: hypothetical protein V1866_04550 [archaeon]
MNKRMTDCERIGSKKGFFSIITAFFFIIVIVFSLIAFIWIYNSIFAVSSRASSLSEKMIDAKLLKDNLLICHGAPYLIESKLLSDECPFSGVTGYSVLQQPLFGCAQKEFSKGNPDDVNCPKYAYYVDVKQQDSEQMCLAKLIICV